MNLTRRSFLQRSPAAIGLIGLPGPSRRSRIDLVGHKFTDQSLQSIDLSKANLTGAVFTRCGLSHGRFVGANLVKAEFVQCTMIGTDFSEANLTGAKILSFYEDQHDHCVTFGAAISFRKANLTRARAHFAITAADFDGATLVETNFEDSMIDGNQPGDISFRNANLSRANLSKTMISNTDFSYANLAQADLSNSKIWMNQFVGANIAGIKLDGSRVIDCDLPNSINLA